MDSLLAQFGSTSHGDNRFQNLGNSITVGYIREWALLLCVSLAIYLQGGTVINIFSEEIVCMRSSAAFPVKMIQRAATLEGMLRCEVKCKRRQNVHKLRSKHSLRVALTLSYSQVGERR